MKKFLIIESREGQRHGRAIAEYDNARDAREHLNDELRSLVEGGHGFNDWNFFQTIADAEAEISFTEEAKAAGDWSADQCDAYLNLLRCGVEKGVPFYADRINNAIVFLGDTEDEGFTRVSYDTKAYEIEEVDAEDEDEEDECDE